MEPIQPFFMPLYKCKNCGEIISQPQLKAFKISYNKHLFNGYWCLCVDCFEKLIKQPKYLYFSKNALSQKSIYIFQELLCLMLNYKVTEEDVFYEEEK